MPLKFSEMASLLLAYFEFRTVNGYAKNNEYLVREFNSPPRLWWLWMTFHVINYLCRKHVHDLIPDLLRKQAKQKRPSESQNLKPGKKHCSWRNIVGVLTVNSSTYPSRPGNVPLPGTLTGSRPIVRTIVGITADSSNRPGLLDQ